MSERYYLYFYVIINDTHVPKEEDRRYEVAGKIKIAQARQHSEWLGALNVRTSQLERPDILQMLPVPKLF